MALFPCDECGKEISDKAATCPHCGAPVTPPLSDSPRDQFDPDSGQIVAPRPWAPDPDVPTASLKRKSEFAGAGCLVQAVGLILLVFWPIGTIMGLILFVAGSFMAVKYACSNCGNHVADKGVKMCPACHAKLK